ncbi:MAG: hypothetical protein ACOCV1_04060 [Bacillota bacterium]
MIKKKNYTKDEILIIRDCFKTYPDNISHACEEAAKKLPGRTANSISALYYGKLKSLETFKVITVGSKKGFTSNVKNTPRKDGTFPKNRKLNKVLWLIKTFLELSEDEQNLVLKILKQ